MPGQLKIDILVENNPYSSVASFSRAFAKALRKKGVKTRLFHIGNGKFYKALYPIINNRPDLTFSFSDIRCDGKPIGEMWRIPHFSYLLDPVMLFLHQLQGDFSIVSCIDRGDYAFTQKLGFTKSFFLPHGVDSQLVHTPSTNLSLFDLTMMGTCMDYDALRLVWKAQFSKATVKLLDEAQEKVLSPQGISCLQALLEGGVSENLPMLHNELTCFVRAKERIDLLRSLEGIPLSIWGKGPWKKYFPKASVYSALPFNQALKIFHHSKIVLNSSPFFKEGAHERIFYALALHALPITGDNPYIREHFEDKKSLLTYSHGQYHGLKEKVQGFLNDEELRREIVERGRKITFASHTWDVRAGSLLNYF